jgi:hypothetical protein
MGEQPRSMLIWKILAIIGGAAAAAGATRVVGLVWRKITNTDIPLNRVPGATTRGREVIWVIASGLTIAFIRLAARRALARLWRARTGEYPDVLVEASTPS